MPLKFQLYKVLPSFGNDGMNAIGGGICGDPSFKEDSINWSKCCDDCEFGIVDVEDEDVVYDVDADTNGTDVDSWKDGDDDGDDDEYDDVVSETFRSSRILFIFGADTKSWIVREAADDEDKHEGLIGADEIGSPFVLNMQLDSSDDIEADLNNSSSWQ